MSAFTFNQAVGREAEFHWRVENNDPANSALILMVLADSGLETDAVLKDKDTFADVLSGTTNEVTNGSYARKTLTDADIAAFTVDDTLDRIVLPMANQTFATIAAGDSWRKGVIGYDNDTTSGTDANIIPVVAFDILINGIAVVPNGNNILLAFPNGYCIAT